MSRVPKPYIVQNPNNKLIKNTHSVSSFLCLFFFIFLCVWVCICAVVPQSSVRSRKWSVGTNSSVIEWRKQSTKDDFYSPFPLGVQRLSHIGDPTGLTHTHTHIKIQQFRYTLSFALSGATDTRQLNPEQLQVWGGEMQIREVGSINGICHSTDIDSRYSAVMHYFTITWWIRGLETFG